MSEKNRLHTIASEKSSDKDGAAPRDEQTPGRDVKQARGMNRRVGHSPNEAGTDQRVEDAKKERANRK